MVIWISLVWALIEMSRFVITGECGWHDRDGSIFAATALVGTFGFIAEVADHRIWPVGSNGFLSAGYYFLVALSGAPLAYFY